MDKIKILELLSVRNDHSQLDQTLWAAYAVVAFGIIAIITSEKMNYQKPLNAWIVSGILIASFTVFSMANLLGLIENLRMKSALALEINHRVDKQCLPKVPIKCAGEIDISSTQLKYALEKLSKTPIWKLHLFHRFFDVLTVTFIFWYTRFNTKGWGRTRFLFKPNLRSNKWCRFLRS